MSILPEQSGIHFSDFVTQLQSIASSWQAIAEMHSTMQAQLSSQLAQNFKTASSGTASIAGDVGTTPSQWSQAQGGAQTAAGQVRYQGAATGSTPDLAESNTGGKRAPVAEPVAPEDDAPNMIRRMAGNQNVHKALGAIGVPGMLASTVLKKYAQGDVSGGQILATTLGTYAANAAFRTGQIGGVNLGSGTLQQAGASMGAANTSSSLTIPGTNIGFQIPFTGSQFGEGFKLEREKIAMRASPRINKSQTNKIFDATNQLGWTQGGPGGPEAEKFRGGLADVVRNNPSLDIQTVAQAMDQATRTGNASISQFTSLLKNDLPSAASAAKVSLNEMLQQTIAFAQASEALGATFQQGAQRATDWANSTGTPAPVGQALMGNSFVQSLALQRTGLLPQQQGLMTGNQTSQISTDSIDLMMKMMKGTTHPSQTKDKFGLIHRVSGTQADAAMVAQMLGISTGQVMQLYGQRGKTERRGEAIDAYRGFLGQTGGDAAERSKDLGITDRMLKQLHYSPKMIDEFHQRVAKDPQAAGQWLKSKLADNRTQTEKNDPNSLTIDLSPGAKQFFRFKPTADKNKKIANAGGKAIVQQIAEGSAQASPAKGLLPQGVTWGGN